MNYNYERPLLEHRTFSNKGENDEKSEHGETDCGDLSHYARLLGNPSHPTLESLSRNAFGLCSKVQLGTLLERHYDLGRKHYLSLDEERELKESPLTMQDTE
jgi:hypothetical protein